MTTLVKRGSGTPATGGLTAWTNLTNAVDGTPPANPATYAVWTNAASGGSGYIEISGYDFSAIADTDTLNSVTVSVRNLVSATARFSKVEYQAWSGGVALGTIRTGTLATSAHDDSGTFACTLAQLKAGTFKVRVTFTRAAVTQSATGSVDHADVTADYTPTPPSVTQAAYRFYADGTETGAVLDQYVETNQSTVVFLGTGEGVSQSFTGDGSTLSAAQWYMQNTTSATGTVRAKIYAHSGTFGTSGVPTGTALASSGTVNAATIPASLTWTAFSFTGADNITLANGTKYTVTCEFTGTDSLRVGVDNTSPTHAGNGATLTPPSAWQVETFDHIFKVLSTGALAAQDTGYTADTSTGDVNLQVRIRLQSTTAVAVPATDDWQLQWEKNTSGTWTNVAAAGEMLIDSYLTGANSSAALNTSGAIVGQSFIGNGTKLSKARFRMNQVGTPTGTVGAVLTNHSGTYGAGGTGVDPVLTTSTLRNASTISAVSAWEEFVFDQSVTLANGVPYVIGATRDTTDSVNYINNLYEAATSTGHAGNRAVRTGAGVWSGPAVEQDFEVYGVPLGVVVPYASANLTNGAATTNRLGAGSGSFVAGKVSEDGLVDDLGWTANNYTEVLYSVTLKQADLAPTDTLRFRVLRNGATTGLTYTQTPTVTIGAGGPTDRTGTATGSITLSGTASGVPGVTGTATGSLTVVGVAAGAPSTPGLEVTGTATGSLTVVGVASGVPGVLGAATGAVAVAGTVTGQKSVTATATGSLSIVGVAAGVAGVTATATGSLALAGTALGVPGVVGTASSSLSLAGTAAGVVTKEITGVAAGSLTLTGTAAGIKTATATATGSLSISGVAAGTPGVVATATGSLAVVGTATGVRGTPGTATGQLSITGTAAATKQVTATATGQVTLSSQALGLVEGNAVGTATGALTITGTAIGVRSTTGTATGQVTVAGTVTGRRNVAATATGSLTLNGTATAITTVTATATGALTITGTATGSGLTVSSIIGEWNDQDVVAMQYGADTVVEWFMVMAVEVKGTATGTLTVGGTATATVTTTARWDQALWDVGVWAAQP